MYVKKLQTLLSEVTGWGDRRAVEQEGHCLRVARAPQHPLREGKIKVQRNLFSSAQKMAAQYVRVVNLQCNLLCGPAEQLLGVARIVLVHGRVEAHDDGEGFWLLPASPTTSRLLSLFHHEIISLIKSGRAYKHRIACLWKRTASPTKEL